MTGGFALFCIMRNGKPKPPTVTGVFLFAKMMIKTIHRQSPPFFTMDNDIFDGWQKGDTFGALTIAIYAFVCFKNGVVNKDDILKAFPRSTITEIDNSLFSLRNYEFITIENQ